MILHKACPDFPALLMIEVQLWDPEKRFDVFKDSICLFRPGDRIKFNPCSYEEFEMIEKKIFNGILMGCSTANKYAFIEGAESPSVFKFPVPSTVNDFKPMQLTFNVTPKSHDPRVPPQQTFFN